MMPFSEFPRSINDFVPEAVLQTGWLIKQSRHKEDKLTARKRRWFVLVENFLYYFKTEEQPSPTGIVPLEYYTSTLDTFRYSSSPDIPAMR